MIKIKLSPAFGSQKLLLKEELCAKGGCDPAEHWDQPEATPPLLAQSIQQLLG